MPGKKSMRFTLKTIIMATSAAALVLACSSFIVYDLYSSRQVEGERIQVLAAVLSEKVYGPLDFQDKEDARDVLKGLSAEGDIVGSRIFDQKGRPWTAHTFRSESLSLLPGSIGEDGLHSEGGHLGIFHPIESEGNRKGTLYILSDRSKMRARLTLNLAVMFGTLVAAILLTFLMGTLLERRVTGPILRLATTVKSVTKDRNYALRAEKVRQDEMGDLIDGINDMLSQIQVRDQALQMAREELELRVEERTAELTYTNDELERSRSELSVSAKQQAAVAELGQRALAGTDVDTIMNDAAQLVAQTLRVEFSRILEMRSQGGFRMRAGTGWSEEKVSKHLDSPEALLQDHGVTSSTSVPIQGEKEPYGILGAHSTQQRTFTQEETNFLRSVANVLATALQRARAEEILRENEERYRQLVEHSPDAVLIHREGRFVYANPAALSLFAASAPAELLGTPLLDRLDPEYGGAVKSRLVHVLQGRKDVPMVEEKLLRLDGTSVDVELAAIPFTQGGQRSIQVVIRDITQRREVERMKAEFISVVSHELRTPLTSIQGSLGLIANGVTGQLPPAAKPMVDIAYNNCQRLVRLINDILDVEKMAAGKMKYSFKPVEIMPLVQQSIEANRGFGQSHGVTFALKGGLPEAKINADSDRVIQVITNLMSNAAKFSSKGASVDVSVSRREDRVRVSIRDYGNGIPENFRSKIFQKFSQADSSDVRKKGGTGLGLVICKAIIDQHGGDIWFESETGKGTTFHFELPEHREAPPDVAPAGEGRILICDDDPAIVEWLKDVLTDEKFRIDVAATAAEADRRIQAHSYRALILDLNLPDRDGVEFLRGLRNADRTRRLPVVVVSARASAARKEVEGSAAAVLDWIDKPVDRARLASSVRLAARHSRDGRFRVLHVEDDPDTRDIVSATLKEFADVAGAATLEEARRKLAEDAFDVVILDIVLPDGSGLDLVPEASRPGRRPTPIIVYSSQEIEPDRAKNLSGALVKSRANPEQLRESIKSLLLDGRRAESQEIKA